MRMLPHLYGICYDPKKAKKDNDDGTKEGRIAYQHQHTYHIILYYTIMLLHTLGIP